MTETSTEVAEAGTRATEAGGPRATWRRWRWPVVAALVVVLAALAAALLVPPTTAGDLDPDSSAPQGSRAVARILEREGVRVTRATSAVEAARSAGAAGSSGSTLVLVHGELTGPEQLRRLRGTGADLVLVAPDAPVLDALAPAVQPAGLPDPAAVDPACDDPAAVAAGRAAGGGQVYRTAAAADRPSGSSARVRVCYPDAQDREAGALVVVDAPGEGRVVVLGRADVLRNEGLDDDGNAALALHILGRNPSLTWYLPSPQELARSGAAPALGELVPRWVPWVAVQLGVATIVALLWRARRLGAVVVEPLPVVVRSAETQEGRARLYRRIGARGRAAATLRTAALRRLAARLDVPADAPPTQVAALVAAVAGREEAAVQAILLGPAPHDDRSLVRLADDLDALEHAVRTSGPTRPPTPSSEDR